jgi:hypothetical protein
MKTTFNYLYSALILCLLCLCSCKKEKIDNVTTNITQVAIAAPSNNTLINLDPSSNAMVTFEWSPASTGNNSLAFYKVIFDKADGDFSKPIYTSTPAKGGIDAELLLTHKEVNKIAYAAGIPELGTGKIKWSVIADNGVVSSTSGIGTIQVTRPKGFAESPAALYITGTATEGGTDLTKALPFKRLSDGVFEVYTALNAGTFNMVDKVTGTPITFIFDGAVLKEGTTATSPVTSKTIYRISLDFNKSQAALTEITSVGLWVSGFNKITATLDYDAAGVWKATGINVAWKQESWGGDERYKFRMVEKDAAGVLFTRNFGSSNKDNTRATATSPASYFLLKDVVNNQYDYTYKFASQSVNTDIEFRLSATADYTHKVTFK